MVEYVSAGLFGGMFVLRCVHHASWRNSMQLTAIEDCLAVAEDEVHITGDVTVREILPRQNARTVIAVTVLAGGKKRILRAQYADIPEHAAVAGDRKRDHLAFSKAEIVGDGQMINRNVIRFNEHGGSVKSSTGRKCS